MNELPKRKRNRLAEYDYSAEGAYFVTICAKDRRNIFSGITGGDGVNVPAEVRLTRWGEIAEEHIKLIPGIDSYVIMPNHIHLIVIKGKGEATNLSQDIKSFKIMVSKRVGQSIWQSSFYDHIIRDENDYLTRRRYIENNPAKWSEDELYNEER